jgi:hypothetical protein
MAKKPKRPRDPNRLAKFIADVVAGESRNDKLNEESAAVKLGRSGGLKGGKARAEKLTPEQKSEIAKKAAQKRWGK